MKTVRKIARKVSLGAAAGLAALGLGACTGNTLDSFVAPDDQIIIVTPEVSQYAREEELLSRLSLILDTRAKDATARAELFYQLGLIYDSIGMSLTARAMFMNSMVQDVNYAKPYNFVGIYFFQEGNFQDAMEAFDAALELDPDDRYINFSRALILYYANRAGTALKDIEKFYEADKDDPYRILWYYFIEREVLGREKAMANFSHRYEIAEKKEEHRFGFVLISMYLGKVREDDLFYVLRDETLDSKTRNEMLCEAYFYLAKKKLEQNDLRLAYDYFKLCLTTRVYGFLEYRYASREIKDIETQYAKMNKSLKPGKKEEEKGVDIEARATQGDLGAE